MIPVLISADMPLVRSYKSLIALINIEGNPIGGDDFNHIIIQIPIIVLTAIPAGCA